MKILQRMSARLESKWLFGALIIFPFLIALSFWVVLPAILIDTDSEMYLNNDPFRTATYPLFLDMFDLRTILPVQLFLFPIAVTLLILLTRKNINCFILSVVCVAIVSNPYVWLLHGTIMSEALVTPILTLLVGLFILFFALKSTPVLAVIAILGGIATTIRPPMIFFSIGVLTAIWLVHHGTSRTRLTLLAMLLWIVPIAAERAYSFVKHGEKLASPVGRSLFMKAALLSGPDLPPATQDPLDQRLTKALNKDFAPVRDLLSKTERLPIRMTLTSTYEACAGYGLCTKIFLGSATRDEAKLAVHFKAAAVPRIKANFGDYLLLNLQDYLGLWLLHPRKTPQLAESYNLFLLKHSPLPFQAEILEYGQATPKSEQSRIFTFNRIVFAFIGLLAALLIPILYFYRRNRYAAVALSLLIGVQAVLILGSFLGTALPRYAMGLWPALISAEIIGLAGIIRQGFPSQGGPLGFTPSHLQKSRRLD